MATSGTYNFLMTRDDIINAALRLTTRFGAADTVPAADTTNCAQALNILCKRLATKAINLWCVQQYNFPTVIGQASYNLSTITNSTLPLRVLDAWIRDAGGNDVSLSVTSRYDYDTLGQKSTQGVPNQAWYDPQLSGGLLTLYNVPQDTTHTIFVVLQRQIQDVNLSTDNPDFPQEAYDLLKWSLADDISLEYSTPKDVRAEIAAKAREKQKDYFDWGGTDNTSVTFAPSNRRS